MDGLLATLSVYLVGSGKSCRASSVLYPTYAEPDWIETSLFGGEMLGRPACPPPGPRGRYRDDEMDSWIRAPADRPCFPPAPTSLAVSFDRTSISIALRFRCNAHKSHKRMAAATYEQI